MIVSVILAHPHRGSFNSAIYETVTTSLAEYGHSVFMHDLYAEGFDPVYPASELARGRSEDPEICKYQEEIIDSDGIVFIHPNWWGSPPAILKGYIDRVLIENVAYRFAADDSGGGVPQGLLSGKKGLVFNTSNTDPQRERDFFGDPLERIWRKCIFEFCGIVAFTRKTFCIVADSTESVRKEWLREAREITMRCFPNALLDSIG